MSSSGADTNKTGSTSPLATWIWNTTLIEDDSQVSQFFSFAEEQGLQRAYLHINADIENRYFMSFIQQCNASGIVVEALMGNPKWILGGGYPTLQANMEWIEQYQGNASADAKFVGIHIDVELWALEDWQANLETYIPAWQKMVNNITSFGRSLGMTLAADLPFWTHTLSDPKTGETMDIWMLDKLDSVTFMTYRNTVDELLDVAAKPLAAANSAGKPIWLAVETRASTEPKVSFKGLATVTTLSSKLKSIRAGCWNHTSFSGIAVHDYFGWVELD
ncbi:hypothetical protein VP1G_08306 [Cytospora mali]|uniref:Uncharacterized protein n=1 Tax=Cytospora mali TaxID=578113 RepID=A0A194VBF2_CYTMA|nr:hypothetical protein VP1G_08306 [Valsa mali var. pyri (nom. inval.)]